MAEFLERNLPRDKLVDVLYFAPHPAILNMLSLYQNIRVTTVDLQSRLANIRMDCHQLGFRDGSFDMLICSHVLEHVHDDIQCMEELHRVLKPAQVALLPVPLNYSLATTTEYGAPDSNRHEHVREYGTDYISRLESVGFQLLPQGLSVMAVRRML